MQRVLAIFALMVCLGSAYAALSACDDTCGDEMAGRQCPPMCPSCSCVTHTSPASLPAVAQVAIVAIAPPVPTSFEQIASACGSPDPQELLHVPRPSLSSTFIR